MQYLDTSLLDGPHLALCLSEQDYLSAMKKYKIQHPSSWLIEGKNATLHSFSSKREDGGDSCISFVCINRLERMSYTQVAGMIVHEAVHVAQQFFEYIGEENPGIEIEAYIIQRIAQNLLFAYEKQASKPYKKRSDKK